jgi:small-conductance mechanosensitive channel
VKFMAFIDTATKGLLDPLVSLWQGFQAVALGLVFAIIVLVIGYLVAMIIGHVIKVLLSKLKVDKAIAKVSLPKSIGKFKVSSIIGEVTKWYIFIIFLQAAVDMVNLGTLSILLTKFVLWLPQLIVAVLAVLLGLFLAHYLSHLIERESNMRGIKLISSLFKILIVFVSFVIALEQIGIEVSILQNTFLIVLASVGAGFALAFGLAFGLGMKDSAKGMYEKFKKKI